MDTRSASTGSTPVTPDPRVWIVVGLCTYELAAICTGRVPTLTELAHRARRHPAGMAAVCAAVGWLWHHLAVEDL
jgi:hypothetical protein